MVCLAKLMTAYAHKGLMRHSPGYFPAGIPKEKGWNLRQPFIISFLLG